MKNLLRTKRKKSPERPPQSISPGNLAGIAAGPPGLQTEPSAVPEGQYSLIGAALDCVDPTVEPDERGGPGPQMPSLARMDVDQDHPALETSTSGGVIGDTRHSDKPTSGYSRSLRFGVMFKPITFSLLSAEDTGKDRGEESKRAKASRSMWRYDRNIGSFSPSVCQSRKEPVRVHYSAIQRRLRKSLVL